MHTHMDDDTPLMWLMAKTQATEIRFFFLKNTAKENAACMQQVQLLEFYTLSFCLVFLDIREIHGAFWTFKYDRNCIVFKVAFSP